MITITKQYMENEWKGLNYYQREVNKRSRNRLIFTVIFINLNEYFYSI